MGSLSSAKTLGGVGGILVFIPFVSLVGWILILLATKEISEAVQDKSIFDDALLAAITAIIGAVVFVAFIISGEIGGLFSLGFGFPGLLFFGILGAFWVSTIISAIFLKRSYEKISQRLNVSAFATAGLLYLIGAALTIVFVGFLIILIALIFQIVAYFSINDRPPSPGWGQPAPQTFAPSPAPPQPATGMQPQPSVESKFCFKCGAKLPGAATFCTSCGAKQQ
ncbi:MAG TPA: DUF996 domain-containing protein [Candidatus Bathyarchaeia archaeon]|nr:DUF996 domain-containing protein [Candidatus Bathyarchaeia archaeon]